MGIIVHAPGVHQGGGRSLLLPLLQACTLFPGIFILDERLRISTPFEPKYGTIYRIGPRLFSRLNAERLLRHVAKPGDIVLCMGSLPPLFPLAARVFVLIQNRYLVECARTLRGFPMRARLRIRLERLWLRFRRTNAHTFIVQTESMREAAEVALGIAPLVMPFLAQGGVVQRHVPVINTRRAYDFLYIASGEPHKNHKNLVEAWVRLARKGLRPHLCLTVNRNVHSDLGNWIEQRTAEFSLHITNLGELAQEDACQLYQDSAALIFPSDLESYGLPLIEARQAGLPILAAELDYVRELVDPEESFDPRSPLSIARAVERYLGVVIDDPEFLGAEAFLDAIVKRGQQDCIS